MSQHVLVVIREDPFRSARAVEALRLALGLGVGDSKVAVVLLEQSVALLAEDRDEIVDAEILDKYLPSFKHLETEFVVPAGSKDTVEFEEGFMVHEESLSDIRKRCSEADRVLVF